MPPKVMKQVRLEDFDFMKFALMVIGPGLDPSIRPAKRIRTTHHASSRVKTLTDHDVDNYTIFDVIMPLPGRDVAYPSGTLGEKYREYLRMDGLDPDNFTRKQRLVNLVPEWHCKLISFPL
jgi:tRNA(Glu) U13 pseudouridine synthase TruD